MAKYKCRGRLKRLNKFYQISEGEKRRKVWYLYRDNTTWRGWERMGKNEINIIYGKTYWTDK